MAKFENITESNLIKTGFGKIYGLIVNSHTNGTLKLVDGSENGTAASVVLTSTGACAPADYAKSVYTSTGAFTADEVVVIGTITYKFVAEVSDAYDVALGENAAEALDNLKLAINGTGVAGTNYGVGTVAHPSVIATTNTDTAQTVRSRTVGTVAETTAINAISTTTTAVNASWADTTLGGGTGDSDPAITTDAATITIGDIEYTAIKTLGESLGLDPIGYHVLWETSEAVFLDNLKQAVNASGIAGTDYSTGTLEHPLVVATTNANDAQTFVAKEVGTGGNSIVSTDTLGNYAFASTTFTGGTGSNARVIMGTYTFPAGSQVLNFESGIDFDNALYATIGGVADITLIVD